MKKLIWLASSHRRLKDFPDTARRKAGHELDQVQNGRMPSDWKPMLSIGPGAVEIRIHDPHEYRVIYVASFKEGIYILHAFAKKTQRTPKRDIELARIAYAEIKQKRQVNIAE